MEVLYGRNIPKKLYKKLIDLDAEIFTLTNEDFSGDTTMPEEALYSMLEKNILSTVVVLDNEEVIAFFHTFPMEREFEKKYVKGEESFKNLNGSQVQAPKKGDINLYLWSLGIKESYRGKKFECNGEKVSIIQLLHEGLIDSLVDMKRSGIVVKNVLGEAVSEKGRKVVVGFCGEDVLIHADEKNSFYMYAAPFNAKCPAFARCRNVKNLIAAYSKEKINEK